MRQHPGPERLELSVVMPVYAGADAAHFRRALESIYAQTYPAAEVIVVEDGPLTPAHYAVLDDFADSDPVLRRIALPVNGGAAAGNQAGLAAARHPWIAKMDSDDICLPERFERQAHALADGSLDLVGSAVSEFDDAEDNIIGVRRLPGSPAQIAAYARRNNPVNHPTVVYRRELALSVGGYQHLPYMEDYDLCARMLAAGARMRNLDESLMLFRAGADMLERRRSPGIFAAELQLQRNLRAYGLTSRTDMAVNIVARSTFRLLPAPVLRFAYKRMFHA